MVKWKINAMIKRLLLLFFLFLTVVVAQAQDVIVFRDSTSIKVNLVEMTPSTILYTKFKSTSDVIYSVNKNSVAAIYFSNGQIEVFEPLQMVKYSEKADSSDFIRVDTLLEKRKKVMFNAKLGTAFVFGGLAKSPQVVEGAYGIFGGGAEYQSFGNAGAGFLVGMKAVVPFTKFGLGAFVGFDVVVSCLKRSFKQQLQQDFTEELTDEWEKLKRFTTKELSQSYMVNNLFFNVPIVVGLNYTYTLNDKVAFYGEMGAGCNVFKSTWMEGRADFLLDGESYRLQEYYEWDKAAVSFCYQMGVGAIFLDRLNVDIRYYGIEGATTNYRYQRITPYRDYDAVEGTTKFRGANYFTLAVGVFF